MIDGIIVRPGTPRDFGYIIGMWAGILHTEIIAHPLLKGTTREDCKRVFGRLIERSDLLVACPATDETSIYGFAVTQGPVVHALYVRNTCRQLGVATRLLGELPSVGVRCSVLTRSSAHLIVKLRDCVYDPRLLGESS